MKKGLLMVATVIALSGGLKASASKNLPNKEDPIEESIHQDPEKKGRDSSNKTWQKWLGSDWDVLENLDLSSVDTVTLITHPLWGFLSDNTYPNQPEHITSIWFKHIEGKKDIDFANKFENFLVEYVKEISQKKHVSVLDKKNLFYIFENLHLVEALKTRNSPGNKNIFILPKHKTGRNNPSKREFQQYSEILKSMFAGVPNKLLTSSRKWGDGYLDPEDAAQFAPFLIKKTFILTGGYVKACLNNTRLSLGRSNDLDPKIITLSLDTVTAIHASNEIRNTEMLFLPEQWNQLLKNVHDNPNFDFSSLKSITNGDIWKELSKRLDSQNLENMEKNRDYGVKYQINGSRL